MNTKLAAIVFAIFVYVPLAVSGVLATSGVWADDYSRAIASVKQAAAAGVCSHDTDVCSSCGSFEKMPVVCEI